MNDPPTSNDVVFEVGETEFLFDLTSYITDVENDDLSINSYSTIITDTLSTVFGGRVIPQGENIFIYEHPQGISGARFLII